MAKIKTIGPLEIDATGAIEVNSSGGTLSIATDSIVQNVNIGTGAAARTITLGNQTGTTGISLSVGTGSFTIDSASGNLVTQLDSGEMTKPLQPAFLANLVQNEPAVTGAGTTFVIGSNTSMGIFFDQGGDFNTNGTFTAPVTGRYQLSFSVRFSGVTSAMTQGSHEIVTSNRTFFYLINSGNIRNSANQYSVYSTVFADMDASDTAQWAVTLSNGVGDTVQVLASFGRTLMSGYLTC